MDSTSLSTSITATGRPTPLPERWQRALQPILARADIQLNGSRPWDLQIHHPRALRRIMSQGSLGLGESYMDGEWDSPALDQMFSRALSAGLDQQIQRSLFWSRLLAPLRNPQNLRRARRVGEVHYDTGNDFFAAMLDSRMTYTCGYWAQAQNLEQAQYDKLDLICRKLQLKPGMRLLDIGCGWGSLMKFAAEHYGVRCVGLTISKQQAAYGEQRMAGLPVQFHLADYRQYQPETRFDRIASVGMFEHVGGSNYAAFFNMAQRCLHPDGLFLLHTIGKNEQGFGTDPWIHRYIFPHGELPHLPGLTQALEGRFIVEDLHNFGADYDRTLMAWYENFETAWPHFAQRYDERFQRMWRYYLLSCAGAFRARSIQLWQWVLSPAGVVGGYRRVS